MGESKTSSWVLLGEDGSCSDGRSSLVWVTVTHSEGFEMAVLVSLGSGCPISDLSFYGWHCSCAELSVGVEGIVPAIAVPDSQRRLRTLLFVCCLIEIWLPCRSVLLIRLGLDLLIW